MKNNRIILNFFNFKLLYGFTFHMLFTFSLLLNVMSESERYREEFHKLLKLSYPVVFATLCRSLITSTDTAVLGHLGTQSLNGASRTKRFFSIERAKTQSSHTHARTKMHAHIHTQIQWLNPIPTFLESSDGDPHMF